MQNISFKLIFRSWWRNKTFAVISILSLAVGIACTNLLAAFVIHEYNVEAGNSNRDRIVLAMRTFPETGFTNTTRLPANLPEILINQVPELDKACTINQLFISTCKAGEHIHTDFRVFETDGAFVRLFPQHVLTGSLEEALNDPNKIVLTESFSKRLFGREDPIGQTLQMQNMSFGFPGEKPGVSSFTVAAVIKENNQAALKLDALSFGRPTVGAHFFLLKNRVSIAGLQAKTGNLFIPDAKGENFKYSFLGIREVSFGKDNRASFIRHPNTNLLFVAFFSAILILAIACFNYVNLSFSRVFRQLYSIHIQKLMGAGIGQLRMQLFADTFMTVGAGFLIAQLMQFDLLSVLNRIMSARVSASFLYSNQVLPVTLLFVLVLALIPAFYMSSRLPGLSVSVYNNFYRGKARRRIIGSLAVVQFAISLVLIIGTLAVRRQLSLLYDKTGNYKHIYVFSAGDGKTSMLSLKERVAHFSGIQAIATSNTTLSNTSTTAYFKDDEAIPVRLEDGDEGIMRLMEHKIIQGLPWETAIKQYPNPAYLNRTWAQRLFPDGELPVGSLMKDYVPGWTENSFLGDQIIAGVVEDYFRGSLEMPVDAGIITYSRKGGIHLQVRTDPEQTEEVIRRIHEEWDKLYPGLYLEHDSQYDLLLKSNRKTVEMSNLLLMYSIISLLLTSFGLFGMSLYAIEQRTKEIGIRKVNGSTTWQIMTLLNRQFIGWIGIAFVIAIPVAWWLLSQWMQNFVYRVGFSLWTYLLSLLIVAGITLLTVSWHSYRAASGNPVDALRDE